MTLFFVYGILPPLEFGIKPEISSKELTEIFDLNLSKLALNKVHVLKLLIDISNIYALFKNVSFDSKGNYSKSTIKALLANEEELPSYVLDFFEAHDKEEDRQIFFPQLLSTYFAVEKKNARGTLKDFLTFEHDLRVLLAGFRAKKGGFDLSKQLQYEDMSEEAVAIVLMQKDLSGKFQFPVDYEDLEKALDSAGTNPSKQYEAIARYRFDYYSKYFINYPFSLKGVLGYMTSLWILEDFFALKRDEGEKFLSNIVERENVS